MTRIASLLWICFFFSTEAEMTAIHIKHHSVYLWRGSPSRFENSHGPAQTPAEQRGHRPCRAGMAAAARHFLDVLHVPWKNITVRFQREIHCPLPLHKRM